MGDEQRAQGVFGSDVRGIADDVRFPGIEPEDLFDGEARVHAGQHRYLASVGEGHCPSLKLYA